MSGQERLENIITPWPEGTKRNHKGFMSIMDAFFGHGDMEAIRSAYEIAKVGHAKQTRENGDRYFDHPRDVAIIIVYELEVRDPKLVILALLHDILEDSFVLTQWAVEKLYGVEVKNGLNLLTKNPKEGYLARLNKFGSWKAVLVKLADRLHNIRTLGECSAAKRQKQIQETREHYLPLADTLIEMLPPQYKETGYKLRQMLKDTLNHWSSMAT